MFEYMQFNIAPWGWEIPLYFFLIGMAGMTFVLASAPNVFGAPAAAMASFQKPGIFISLILLAICGPLLIMDLGQPGRFLYPILYFHWTSPLSWGSLFLPLFGVCIIAFAIGIYQGRTTWLKPFGILGGLLALSMPLYTGLDLMVNSTREMWANPIIPVFFVILSISSGAGLTALAMRVMGTLDEAAALMLRNVLYFSLAITLALFLGGLTSLAYGSAEQQQVLTLINAEYGSGFWLFSFIGCTLLPLFMVIMPSKARDANMVVLAGLLATVGAYTFRTIIVEAGQLPQLFY